MTSQKKLRKEKTPYSPTKVKARNFLSNISYRRILKGDFFKVNFIIDVITYLILDLKPFFLHDTFADADDREMILMLWNQCLPKSYYNYVKKPEIFEYLLNQNVCYRGVNAIVKQFVSQLGNWTEIKNYFNEDYSNYQYIYSMLFPKYYSQNKKPGLKNKIKFALAYERWREGKKMEQLGKNPFNFNVPDNFEIVQRHDYEQKPIKVDDDIEFGRDVVDTKAKKQKTDSTDGNCSNEENKENIMPCPPPSPLTYKYAPTMCRIRQKVCFA